MTKLSEKQKYSVGRIGGLVIVNAMIFQEVLANTDSRVHSLQRTIEAVNPIKEFANHWQYIVDKINYYPIFHIARELVLSLTASNKKTVVELVDSAQQIVSMQAALRHDLMGRVYHRLLLEAKYLGTYYTSIPSATLLLKLALRPDAWDIAWDDLQQVANFRVADIACGTGTLLIASSDAISDNYVRASAAEGKPVSVSEIQKTLTENVLYGYDVLASATHLTASTLALKAPDVPFKGMHLFALPLGGPEHRLGSIEFLESNEQQMPLDMFGALPHTKQVTGHGAKELESAALLPQLDLGAINPPFTRSVGGNLLFGSVPDSERAAMQTKLKRIVQDPKKNVSASITAGLGSVFVATLDRYIKTSGRIALVLPKALLSGVSWRKTRDLIAKKYQVEYLIASQDPERWNFSESTSLSEVLLIALKIGPDTKPRTDLTVALNLWRNPRTAFESLAIAQTLLRTEPPDVVNGQGALEVEVSGYKAGEAISMPWLNLKKMREWILPCAFAQSDLVRVAYGLEQGKLILPGQRRGKTLVLRALSTMGTLGPDRRDIHDGFKLSTSTSAYPSYWGHNAGDVTTLTMEPNRYLTPLSEAKSGRGLRKLTDLWPQAGRVLFAERMRLNTQRLTAIRLPVSVLSNVWWSFALKTKIASQSSEKAIVLWQNSTLGLLLLLSHREETEGAWIDFKKPILLDLPVLDLTELSSQQLNEMAATYDRLQTKELKPLAEMGSDEVRAEIDKTIAGVLNLPDVSVVRNLMAQEPVICLRRL
jgi:N-6 DNA Methylase